MTEPHAHVPEDLSEAKLPRRDWIVLPLLAVLTVGLLSGSTELIARRMFPAVREPWGNCMVLDDPATGVRGIPNSVCRIRTAESDFVEYRMNRCGHRAGMECGPKAPDAFRIVMTGSSFALGTRVQREQTFAALLPQQLSTRTGHRVELYNESMGWGSPRNVALRFDDVLEAKPDLILWVLTPWDIQQSPTMMPELPGERAPEEHGVAKRRVKKALDTKPVWKAVPALAGLGRDLLGSAAEDLVGDQTRVMMRHFLFESESVYLESYLRGNDRQGGFLKVAQSAEWQNDLLRTEIQVADIERRAEAAGVPFVAVLLPNRAQAAMISAGEWPSGYDPYKLGQEVRTIVEAHGGTYIDVLPNFRTIPNPERHYLPIDGHPDASGHAIISGLLAEALTTGKVSVLKAATPPQIALRQGR